MGAEIEKLKNLKREHEFFIGFDSDGCVFDTMEIKHKECFCPAMIYHFALQSVSKFARETWDFVNLYSKSRGCNRFIALLKVMDLLKVRREVVLRNKTIPDLKALASWVGRESKLGNPSLEKELSKNSDPQLKTVLEWSRAVNDAIERMVKDVPPFPYVRECLEAITPKADTIVVSQTPCAALEREWKEHGIDPFVKVIAGQEMGSKTEHLALSAKGRYRPDRILMIGDAPGDLAAARANGALFFPVNPGHEDDSWKRLHDEGLDRFFRGAYGGEYEKSLIDEFEAALPDKAPWMRT